LTFGPVNLKVIFASNTTIHPDSSIFLIFNYPVSLSEIKKNTTFSDKSENIDFGIIRSLKNKEYGYYYYNNYYYTDNEEDTLNFLAVEIKPKSSLKSSHTYNISIFIKENMRNSENFTIYTLGDFKYIHRENIDQISYNESNINIEFTNPVKTEDVFKNVFFITEGKTESLFDYYYSYQSDYFDSYKKIVPGGNYMIKIGENLKDIHGSKIKNPGLYNLIAGDYHPFILFTGGYLNPVSKLQLRFSMMNMSKFNLFLEEMTVYEFIKEIAKNNYEDWDRKGYKNWFKKKYEFQTEKNVLFSETLDIDKEYGHKSKLGMGVLEYTLREDTYDINFSYQVTPLRMHTIMSSKNGFVFLSDRKGESLIKGLSTLYVYNIKGSPLFSVPLKDGFLSMNKPQMKWFEVKNDNYAKLLYVKNQENGLLMTYYLPSMEKDSRSYIFTDKNLYKLDDSVFVTGIVRDIEGNKVKYSAIKKLNYSVMNPDYKEVCKGQVNINKNGVFSLKIMVPDSFKTGYYYVQFRDKKYYYAQVSFIVQEFKEPTFEVSVSSEKTVYLVNENIKVNVKGNYLSGMKMAGDSLYSSLIIHRTSYYSKKFPEFNFYISNDTTVFNSQAFDRKDTLNKAGEFIYSENVRYSNVKNPLSIQYIGTVKGIDKEGISQSVSLTKYYRENYAGLKISNYTDKDDSTLFEVIVSDNKDNPVKRRTLKLRIIREYSYKDSVPDTLEIKTLISKEVPDSIWIKLDKRAYYFIELEYEGTKISQSFYYGWWWFSDESKKILTITPDKNEYSIGDTAKIKMFTPVPEVKHYYYFNTDSIYGISEIKFSGDTAEIAIPVTKNLINGFYLSVFALPEDSTNKLQMQTIFVKVSSETKRLLFDMMTNREVFEPNDTVEITLETKLEKDVTAIITVVDEAVLMLTGYSYYDPMSIFYGYYENHAYYANSSNLQYPYYYPYKYKGRWVKESIERDLSQISDKAVLSTFGENKEAETIEKTKKGGEVPQTPMPQNVSIRKDFTQLPFYSEKILFSKNKKGRVNFRLPDNIGKFRINCVVLSEDEFNVKEQKIRVEKKIIINQSLPQFLRPFDKIDASFSVLDNTGIEGEVNVKMNSKEMKFAVKNEAILETKNNKALALFRG
ncbi:MAG: hypothetical protein COX48_05890, partial [bacterium (Candidatus Stahlbacteria) CG23_combo_of_CG06-09_8_20_14_all_34_7]